MTRYDRVRENYENVTERLFSDKAAFEDYLKFAGKFFKLPSVQSMIIYGTNPKAVMVADYDTWTKFNRHVKRGTSSIAVLDNGGLKHYFDISQTNGSKTPYQWTLDKNTAGALIDEVYEQSGMRFKSFSGCVNYLGAEQARETVENVMNTLNVSEENRAAFEKSYASMTQYLIAARCELGGNFKYNGKLDLSALDMLHSKAEKERLCEFVQLAGKSVLMSLEKSINNIVMQERTVDYGRNKTDMVRGGQDVLPRNQGGKRQDVQARPDNVRVSGANGTGSDGGRTGTDERADRTVGREMAQANGGNAPRTDTVASRSAVVGTDTPTDRPRSVGAAEEPQSAVREEIPSTVGREFQGSNGVGEHVRSDSGRGNISDGGTGSHRVNGEKQSERGATYSTENTEQTAEENSPAFSVDEISIIADKLFELSDKLTRNYDGDYAELSFANYMENLDDAEYNSDLSERENAVNMLSRGNVNYIADYLKTVYSEAFEGRIIIDEGRSAEQLLSAINSVSLSEDKPIEIPDNIDKFYVNEENESVIWAYFNPDSDAGGQLVYHTFTYDQLFEAIVTDDPMDYLEQVSKTELVDVTEPNFKSAAQEFLKDDESFSSREEDMGAKLSALVEPRYAIYQLKDGDKTRDYRFASFDELKNNGLYVDRENYNRVYRARMKGGETLEDIFTKFNIDRPEDFRGHSLSTSDIIAVKQNGKAFAQYVDSAGFKEITDFFLSREERKARRTLTDNLTLLADNQLASDEMDTLGDKLFRYDEAPKYKGSSNSWLIGAGMTADEFESITTRYHNGEDVRAELAKGMYGKLNHIEFFERSSDGIDDVEISSIKDENGITFRTKGGFEITHSWETLGEALISAARQEFDRHEEFDRQYREQEEKAKAAEAPYVTVTPFSNVDFAKIGLDSEKHYTIPEFNEALAKADKLYTADENNSLRVDTFTVTLHIGENDYQYRPMLGAEYGTLSAIMDAVDLVNASNISITTQEKEIVAEIERTAQVRAFKEKTAANFSSINGFNSAEIENVVRDYVQDLLESNDIDAKIVDVAVVGSRSRRLESDNSDLDVVIEFTSDLKEDALFNILHDELFEIGGVTIDINPIRKEETGTIGAYLENAEKTIYENHERKLANEQTLQINLAPRENPIHFGLLGNGITVYDTSKTDKETNDYPTVAHISDEGNIKYYTDDLSEDDKRRIEEQAAKQKKTFTENWYKLPIETRYERLLDEAGARLTDITNSKHDSGLSMEETLKKYEHSVIFKDEPFPAKEPSLIKDEDTIFEWSKYAALGAHSAFERIIHEKNTAIDTSVKISLSPKAEDWSDYALEIGIKPCAENNQLYFAIEYNLRNEKTEEITEVGAYFVDTDGVMIAGHSGHLPDYETFRTMVERNAAKTIDKIRELPQREIKQPENTRERTPEEIYKGMSDVDRTFFDVNAYADILYIEGLVEKANANKPAEQTRLADREKMYAERFGTTPDEFRALIRYHEAELKKHTVTVSHDDLRVGDYVRGDGAMWRITGIDGDFSITFENTDKTDIRSVQSIIGHWKENFVKQGFEYVSPKEIRQTADTPAEPVVENDNDEEFEEIPDEPTNDYIYGEQLSFFGEPAHEVENPEKKIIGGIGVEEALKHELITNGTGFVDGKFRVEQFYREHKGDTKGFAKFLSDAYGVGGHSGEGKVWLINHDSKGLALNIRLDSGESTAVSWSWSKVANRIATLIDNHEYITQRDIDERIRRAKYEMAHNDEDSKEYKAAAEILDNYGLLPEKEDIQRIEPNEIKAGDSFMYRGSVVTVTDDKGIYPDDIVITREEKMGGLSFAVTENVNAVQFAREAKHITPETKESELTEEQTAQQERSETSAAPEQAEEPAVEIKNLAQLKRALTVGAEFDITSYIRDDVVNQRRRVSYADTAAIYSIRPDAPDDAKTTLANGGRGSYLPWEKASDWEFANGVCTAYRKGKEHTEENRLFSIKVRQPVLKRETENRQTAEISNPLVKELAKTFDKDTAERLYNAFEGAKMANWNDNQAKINRVKRALYDILGNEEQTESAFAVLAAGEAPKLRDIVIDLSPNTARYEREEIPAQTQGGDMTERLSEIAKTANTKIDYTITDENLGIGGAKEKFAANIAAIETLKRIESRNLNLAADMFKANNATPEEQKILAGYVGWGGLSQAFDPNNASWAKEYRQLKELLTDEEYAAAKGSTLNAHYTTPTVIGAIYKGLQNLGFEGGNILEPAMGVGNFFGCMPEEIRKNSHLSGVELDSITGRIAQQLYQNADIQVKGFEKTDFSDNYFDAAVGNVPFGSYPVSDKRYNRENFFIHDYFLAKTLDKLAPGGVAALITTKGTLDKENPKVREYLARRADLIGAIRLPNTAFKANAGTEVTTDILFLQKREKMAVELPDWCYIARDNNGVPVNQYFIDHPEMVLGTMKQGIEFSLYGNEKETACVPVEGADLKQQLEAAVANLKTNNAIRKHTEQRKAEAGVIAATADVRNFTFAEVDGKMYFRENNIMTEAADKNGKALTGKALERIRALCELRQTFRTILTAQENNCSDAQLQAYQKILNEQYDAFVKKYGHINDSANYQVFGKDDDYNSLCALELINEETHEVTKSAFFSKRTVKQFTEITRVDTPQEALFVSVDTLGKLDIPYMAKLCEKSPDEVIDALKADNLIYLNPKKANPEKPYEGWEEASEYLSGNVRIKLRAAERAAKDNPSLQRNVDALTAVIPQKLEAGDITARIGVHWVDVEDYQKFLQEYAKAHFAFGEPLRRSHNGEYKIPYKGRDISKAATEIFGTKRMNSLEIFENLLNNRDVVVKDKKIDPDGKEHYEINKKETELAQDKASKMKEAFKRWLWEEPERREKYVTRYNELFNCIVGRKYDGSHQTFPGMSPSISLKPHQLDAVARAKFGGNTLLAHCVGAGKSFEMVAATMEKKRLGLINKACVVVPKALVGQMASEWLRLYPQAKILTATEKDFDKDHRQKFIGRCCTGDYDAVIMSYEQFEKIPMSFEYRRDFIQREIDTLTTGIDDLKSNGGRNENSGSIKDMERTKKRLEARLQKLIEDNGKTKDTSLNFEQLGFDSLVVDEAHNYKNGLVVTKMQRVAGVQTTPAQKSEDILMKTRYLNENYGERNLLFATGTPVSNSMSELYIMQRYLRPTLLDQAGLQTFDDWASTFGEVVSKAEMKPAGNGYRTKKRFAKFNNLPELMAMYKEFADIRTADMLDLPVPKIKGGKPETIVAEPNAFQKEYMKVLAERSEQVHSGAVDATQDNMLKITGEARLLGLDVRSLNPEAPNYPDSKVNLLINKIMEIYTQTTTQKGVQAVFCDIAVNGDNEAEELSEGGEQKAKKPKSEKTEEGKFSVYNYIKAELIRRGVPADEICFAGDADTVKKQNEMKAQLRSGTKRIVLSSTSKLGTGANIQNKLVALHNLDIPWKPSDLEQRLGRIVRQGNENDEVGIYNYVTKDTFDAYMMNIIVTKQKFISQLNTTTSRSCEDVDDLVLNYSEIQAMAVGDERIKEKIELDMDVSRLKMLESEYYNEQYRLDDTISDAQKLMKNFTHNIAAAKDDLAFAQENRYLPDNFKVEIAGKVYTDRKEAGTALREAAVEFMANDNGGVRQPIGTFCGFELSIGKSRGSFGGAMAEIVIRRGISYTTEMDLMGDIGNTTRLENLFSNGIGKKIASLEERAERTNADLQAALANKGKPFEHAEELAQKSARLEQLNLELEVGKVDEVIIADDESEREEHDRDKDAHDNDRDKPTPPKRGRR